MMNTQYSRVGRSYPKMVSNVLDTKSTKVRISFSIIEENKSVGIPTDSKVIRLLTK